MQKYQRGLRGIGALLPRIDPFVFKLVPGGGEKRHARENIIHA
jgi:hypothetical protein